MKGQKVVPFRRKVKVDFESEVLRKLSDEIIRQMERQKSVVLHQEGNFYTKLTFDPPEGEDEAFVIIEQDLDFEYAPVQVISMPLSEFIRGLEFVVECLEEGCRQEE